MTTISSAACLDIRERLVGLKDVAGNELETPCYAYDTYRMRKTFTALREQLTTPVLVRFGALPNLDVLGRLNDLIAPGLSVSSVWELQRLARSYGGGSKVASSVAMTEEFVVAAAASRAHCVVDGIDQLRVYCAVSHPSKSPDVSLQLRSDGASSAGLHNRAGMGLQELVEVARLAKESGLRITGVRVTSNDDDLVAGGCANLEMTNRAISMLRNELAIDVTYVYLGWELETKRLLEADLASYRSGVSRLLGAGHKVFHEVGRSLFEDAGSFLTRVVHTREWSDHLVAVCDGSVARCLLDNGQWRAAERRAVLVVAAGESRRSSDGRKVVLAGASSHPLDVLSVLEDGTEPLAGDLCAVLDCGASHDCFAASPQAARLPEYLV